MFRIDLWWYVSKTLSTCIVFFRKFGRALMQRMPATTFPPSLSQAQIYLTGSLSFSLSVLGGLAGIGEVGQQWWPRPVRKEKARFCLGGTDKTCFQRESRSLWSDSKRGRSGSQWNNPSTLMWKGKVINSSICSFLTLPFTKSPAGMAESDTIH